ncbi:RNA polymerase sigma-70 factor sigma-B/F/G subfamily [Bacillus phage Deep Blue]|uniref:RNA polymerase sigma-70 factor sigma-B/F/G subfamily n=1 Tax=Bacillus phage Deep Blue TaxID=1792245 RepID=A0A140HLQ0_9CAUD|nr:RNA polymerase sigma factor [Bacillus phage Deep Blue]AMO25912.1 RNA polymerase sigma-70 factor sigma-B/F/G subfamily [Bacillus phage Deep Blue]
MRKKKVGSTYTFAKNVLTKEETYELIEKSQAGEEEATESLVEHNARLVNYVVRRVKNPYHEHEDLFQLGMIGLITAIDKFDLTKGVQFSTYAVRWIEAEIGNYVKSKTSIVKIPREIGAIINKILALKLKDEEPAIIMEKLKLDDNQLNNIIIALEVACNEVISLDMQVGTREEDTVAATVGQDVNQDWFSGIAFYDIIRFLDDKERSVLTLKFVHDQSSNKTAKMLGTYANKISRLERTALDKLRERYTYEELIN